MRAVPENVINRGVTIYLAYIDAKITVNAMFSFQYEYALAKIIPLTENESGKTKRNSSPSQTTEDVHIIALTIPTKNNVIGIIIPVSTLLLVRWIMALSIFLSPKISL